MDIYSLGVVFYEMSRPTFPTEMERVETLDQIRKLDIVIPNRDELTEKEVCQNNLFKKCYSHWSYLIVRFRCL